MVLEIKTHIELRDDDPLKAVIAGTKLKAYLVAQFAIGWGLEEALKQYSHLSRADLYAVLTFYYDHEQAITERLDEVEAQLKANSIDGWQQLDTMRKRLTG